MIAKMINVRKNIASSAFTIVELLVVIVVIGILASITIVSYRGITQKASVSTIQADLANASKQLKIYQANYGSFPLTLDANKCPLTPTADTTLCLKPSNGSTYTYYPSTNGSTFRLTEANNDGVIYSTTEARSPSTTISAAEASANWVSIGSQLWAKTNLNVGTRIAGASNQTNNSILEKYCYGDTDAGCTNTDANGATYGALYQWDEAMQYTNTEGAQGICPTGSHIPTDNDWKILEMQLGMTQTEADKSATWRGTNQGTQLKFGGGSGLNIPLSGIRNTGGSFLNLSSDGNLWSSSESSTTAWFRHLYVTTAVDRDKNNKAIGYSVRCVGN